MFINMCINMLYRHAYRHAYGLACAAAAPNHGGESWATNHGSESWATNHGGESWGRTAMALEGDIDDTDSRDTRVQRSAEGRGYHIRYYAITSSSHV